MAVVAPTFPAPMMVILARRILIVTPCKSSNSNSREACAVRKGEKLTQSADFGRGGAMIDSSRALDNDERTD